MTRTYTSEGRKRSGMKRHDPKRAIRTIKFYSVKYLAKKRGHAFQLTNDEFYDLCMQNCHYCGSPPLGTCFPTAKLCGRASKMEYDRSRPSKYNGIDRINNEKGYSPQNCVPCCKICNLAKRCMSVTDFREWVKKVYLHMFGSSGQRN